MPNNCSNSRKGLATKAFQKRVGIQQRADILAGMLEQIDMLEQVREITRQALWREPSKRRAAQALIHLGDFKSVFALTQDGQAGFGHLTRGRKTAARKLKGKSERPPAASWWSCERPKRSAFR